MRPYLYLLTLDFIDDSSLSNPKRPAGTAVLRTSGGTFKKGTSRTQTKDNSKSWTMVMLLSRADTFVQTSGRP